MGMIMKNGVPYAHGSEIPQGGTKGQVLAKASNISGDFEWANGGGGSSDHVELTQAEYDALSMEEKKNGKVYFITDGEGGGNTESVALTQAEYDALSEEEKNSETVYYITDGQGSDKDTCVVYIGYPSKPDTQWAEIKSAWDDKKAFLLVGVRGNVSPASAAYYDASDADGERVELVYASSPYKTVSRPDNSLVQVYTDTNWLTLTGDYFDIRYRKKDDVVYVTWNFVGIKQALAAKTPVTNCTLPEGFRPKETAYTTVIENAAWNLGYIGVQVAGAMRLAYEQAISQGTGTMFGSLSYPV